MESCQLTRNRRRRVSPARSLALAALIVTAPAWSRAAESGGHGDPAAGVVLGLAIVLVAAKIGGEIAVRLGQASVLGELVSGVVLGNLDLVGITFFDGLGSDPGVDLIARLGALILLFEVGVESTVGQMLKVGFSALLVAVLGVTAPFFLGWAAAFFMLPDASLYTQLFVGATLTATSVGITARVFSDLGHASSPEARVILGAAVIDDVLGLVILAVVTALIHGAEGGGAVSAGALVWIFVKALLFLVAAIGVGMVVSKRLYSLAARLNAKGVLLALSLAFCFTLAWAADAIGLASIVGAFAAGLILEEVHYEDFVSRGEHRLEDLLRPISSFLVPVFFVVMGARTDLRAFGSLGVLVVALVFTLVAIIGKQASGLGVLGKGTDRLLVGLGMIPRGEVGLIFANIGLSLSVDGRPVVDSSTFAAIVVMVILTTMLTPPLVKWRLAARAGAR